MTHLALLRKSRLRVVGIRRAAEILQVARNTTGVGQVVVTVDMALRTLNRGVRAGEREPRGIVIKGCSRPGNRGVTGVASRGESALHVVRVGRSLEVLHVAGRAGPGVQAVVAVHMTLRALEGCVRARKCEPGTGMIKGGTSPRGRVVASLTGLWQLRLHVIRIGCALVILHVA